MNSPFLLVFISISEFTGSYVSNLHNTVALD